MKNVEQVLLTHVTTKSIIKMMQTAHKEIQRTLQMGITISVQRQIKETISITLQVAIHRMVTNIQEKRVT